MVGVELLDITATKVKEIYIQAELYRLLRDYVIGHIVGHRRIGASGPVPPWYPKDVLIEATIRDGEETKEADIVLLTSRQLEDGSPEVKPALVIEVKSRRISRLSVSYGAYLKQAFNYAALIDCSNYAVYDGKNFILMQLTEPYMVGFTDFAIGHNQDEDDDNIGNIWWAARVLSEEPQIQAIRGLAYHSDINIWRKVIPVLIRQAYQRSVRMSGKEPSPENIEETGQRLGKKWLDKQDLRL